jgi:uncharacterized protein involved in exopolysaccharide biosynthesis
VNQNPEVGYPAGGPEYAARAPNARLPRLLGFLRRLWWVPLLTLSIAVGGTAFYLTLQPVTYASSARMWVSGKLHIPEGSLYSEELQFFFGTQVELMQSEKIQQRALARVQALNPDLKPSPVRVRVAQAPKSAVFMLSAIGSEPAYTQAHLNALIDEYLNYKKEIRAASSDDTLASISEQVYQQEKELKVEQEKLSDFQKDNSLAVLQEQSSAAASYLSRLNAQLSDLKLEYQLLDSAPADPIVRRRPTGPRPVRLPSFCRPSNRWICSRSNARNSVATCARGIRKCRNSTKRSRVARRCSGCFGSKPAIKRMRSSRRSN